MLSLKEARGIETFKTWPFYWRFYYRFVKRPVLKIVMPFYNTGRDYYYVAIDHGKDFKKTPIRMTINWIIFIVGVTGYLTKESGIKDVFCAIRCIVNWNV